MQPDKISSDADVIQQRAKRARVFMLLIFLVCILLFIIARACGNIFIYGELSPKDENVRPIILSH